MNNKSNPSVGSSTGGRNASPSPPSSCLCFRQSERNTSNNSNSGNVDKKQHRHHYQDPYPNIGLCGCHRTSKSRCVSAFGKYTFSMALYLLIYYVSKAMVGWFWDACYVMFSLVYIFNLTATRTGWISNKLRFLANVVRACMCVCVVDAV